MILETVDRAELFAATLKARQLADFVRPGPTAERETAEAVDYVCDVAVTLQSRIEKVLALVGDIGPEARRILGGQT